MPTFLYLIEELKSNVYESKQFYLKGYFLAFFN